MTSARFSSARMDIPRCLRRGRSLPIGYSGRSTRCQCDRKKCGEGPDVRSTFSRRALDRDSIVPRCFVAHYPNHLITCPSRRCAGTDKCSFCKRAIAASFKSGSRLEEIPEYRIISGRPARTCRSGMSAVTVSIGGTTDMPGPARMAQSNHRPDQRSRSERLSDVSRNFAGSFGLDAGRLDDRPPLLDFGLMEGGECLRRHPSSDCAAACRVLVPQAAC